MLVIYYDNFFSVFIKSLYAHAPIDAVAHTRFLKTFKMYAYIKHTIIHNYVKFVETKNKKNWQTPRHQQIVLLLDVNSKKLNKNTEIIVQRKVNIVFGPNLLA